MCKGLFVFGELYSTITFCFFPTLLKPYLSFCFKILLIVREIRLFLFKKKFRYGPFDSIFSIIKFFWGIFSFSSLEISTGFFLYIFANIKHGIEKSPRESFGGTSINEKIS